MLLTCSSLCKHDGLGCKGLRQVIPSIPIETVEVLEHEYVTVLANDVDLSSFPMHDLGDLGELPTKTFPALVLCTVPKEMV